MGYIRDKAENFVDYLASKLGYNLIPEHYHFMTGMIHEGILIGINNNIPMDKALHIESVINTDEQIGLLGCYLTSDVNKMRDHVMNKYGKEFIIDETESPKRGRGRPCKDACKTLSKETPKKGRGRPKKTK